MIQSSRLRNLKLLLGIEIAEVSQKLEQISVTTQKFVCSTALSLTLTNSTALSLILQHYTSSSLSLQLWENFSTLSQTIPQPKDTSHLITTPYWNGISAKDPQIESMEDVHDTVVQKQSLPNQPKVPKVSITQQKSHIARLYIWAIPRGSSTWTKFSNI